MGELAGLVGSWRLRSVDVIWADTGDREPFYGTDPDGYMVFSQSGRIMFVFGPSERHVPRSEADQAALFAGLIAFTGRVRPLGPGGIVISVDYAWNPAWGAEQTRYFKLEGDRLEISTPEQTYPAKGDRRLRAVLVWEREGG